MSIREALEANRAVYAAYREKSEAAEVSTGRLSSVENFFSPISEGKKSVPMEDFELPREDQIPALFPKVERLPETSGGADLEGTEVRYPEIPSPAENRTETEPLADLLRQLRREERQYAQNMTGEEG